MRNRAQLRPGLLVLGWAVVLALFLTEAVVAVDQHRRPDRSSARTRVNRPPATPPTRPAAVTSGPAPSSKVSRKPQPTKKTTADPFDGTTVGIDPGHNGRNYANTSFINRRIFNGRTQEACNTTGTATNGGYSEAQFTFAVATYLAADLRARGANVVLTRTSNEGVGPCVDQRAQMINRARADVAIDIHGNGEPAGVRGFSVLVPVAAGPNDAVVAPSRAYAALLRDTFAKTGMPVQGGGIVERNDLAGLNLTTVPQVLIECGNMRNATDARLMTSARFQRAAAAAIRDAMAAFLSTRR